MTHERDQSHTRATSGSTAELDATTAPGRAARTDALIGPNGPRPSGLLMRNGAGSVAPDAEHAVGAAASSTGHALPDQLRSKFEGSLGTDLADVRIHTGSASVSAAAAVGAKAYALGNDIHFGAGHYAPSSESGQRLLAHEVAHTVQQRGGSPTRQHKLEVSSSGDHFELEADRAADAMMTGSAMVVGSGGRSIQREEEEKEKEESESGNSQASVTVGDKTTTYGVSKDGKKTALSETREFELAPFGPNEVCGTPPLFVSGGLSAKVMAAYTQATNDKGEAVNTLLKGSISVELAGKLLMGAAVKELGKVGLEGVVSGSLALPTSVKITDSGKLELPKDIVAPILVEVTIGLVGEVGDKSKKLGGAVTRTLTSLKAGEITLNDSGVHFKHCSWGAVEQAGKDLLWNSAETLLPGGPLIERYERDKNAQAELDKSTKEDSEAVNKFGSGDQAYVPSMVPTSNGQAAREADGHIELRKKIAAAAVFNAANVSDPRWWKHGADSTWNAATISRMNGNRLRVKFEACDGGNEL
ncbi:MAG: DUF4157 domain-containing protein, partial [Kofleriaceae bacterium]